MNRDEVIKIINDFLVDELEITEDKLIPTARFKEDLGVDSLDFVDIAVIIEKNFKFKIMAEEMKDVRTLQDFYNYIVDKINNNNN